MLISGATSPLGSYLAAYFGRRQWRLIAHGRSQERLDVLRPRLAAAEASFVAADFTSDGDLDAMFTEVSKSVKHVDLLLNCAFGKLEDPLSQTDSARLREFFAVSLAGTADVIRRTLPLLEKSQAPRIVNVVADWGFPMHNIMTGPSAYIAGKYGVHGLGAALQMELGDFGIRTTNLCPGILDMEPCASDEEAPNVVNPRGIHPVEVARAIEFVADTSTSHVRSIVLSPTDPKYNGL